MEPTFFWQEYATSTLQQRLKLDEHPTQQQQDQHHGKGKAWETALSVMGQHDDHTSSLGCCNSGLARHEKTSTLDDGAAGFVDAEEVEYLLSHQPREHELLSFTTKPNADKLDTDAGDSSNRSPTPNFQRDHAHTLLDSKLCEPLEEWRWPPHQHPINSLIEAAQEYSDDDDDDDDKAGADKTEGRGRQESIKGLFPFKHTPQIQVTRKARLDCERGGVRAQKQKKVLFSVNQTFFSQLSSKHIQTSPLVPNLFQTVSFCFPSSGFPSFHLLAPLNSVFDLPAFVCLDHSWLDLPKHLQAETCLELELLPPLEEPREAITGVNAEVFVEELASDVHPESSTAGTLLTPSQEENDEEQGMQARILTATPFKEAAAAVFAPKQQKTQAQAQGAQGRTSRQQLYCSGVLDPQATPQRDTAAHATKRAKSGLTHHEQQQAQKNEASTATAPTTTGKEQQQEQKSETKTRRESLVQQGEAEVASPPQPLLEPLPNADTHQKLKSIRKSIFQDLNCVALNDNEALDVNLVAAVGERMAGWHHHQPLRSSLRQMLLHPPHDLVKRLSPQIWSLHRFVQMALQHLGMQQHTRLDDTSLSWNVLAALSVSVSNAKASLFPPKSLRSLDKPAAWSSARSQVASGNPRLYCSRQQPRSPVSARDASPLAEIPSQLRRMQLPSTVHPPAQAQHSAVAATAAATAAEEISPMQSEAGAKGRHHDLDSARPHIAREQQQQQCASEPEITLSLPPTETNVPSGLDAFLRLRQCAQRGQPTRDSNSEEAQQQHQQRQEEVPQQHQHQPPQQRPENAKQPKNDQPTTGSPSSLAPNLLCFVSDKVLQHMDLTLALEDK